MEGGDDNDEDERAKSPAEDDGELISKKRLLGPLPMGLHWSGPPTTNNVPAAVSSLPTAPTGANGHLAAHEYLARYYQLMQHNAALQQQHRGAGHPTSPASALLQEAVAAAANGAAAARKIAAE